MSRMPEGGGFVSSDTSGVILERSEGSGRNPQNETLRAIVSNHAKGVYIIRPSDGISSMHSIVYHPCNAWYIIKALPCIPLPSF